VWNICLSLCGICGGNVAPVQTKKPQTAESLRKKAMKARLVGLCVSAYRSVKQVDLENLRHALHVDYTPEEMHLNKLRRAIKKETAQWKSTKTYVHVAAMVLIACAFGLAYMAAKVDFNTRPVPLLI